MYLLLLFSIFILNGIKADDCSVTQVEQIAETLKECSEIIIGDLHVPSTGELPVLNLNNQNLTFNGRVTFDARYQDQNALLTITGNDFIIKNGQFGIIDGQGALYWDGKGILSDVRKPILIKIDQATNGHLSYLSVLNCPQACVEISRSDGIIIEGWTIDVTDGSKDNLGVDTHGFTFKNSSNTKIQNSRITNQGDCLSINQGHSMRFFSIQCMGSQGVIIRPEWTWANYIRNISLEYIFVHKGYTGISVLTSPNQPAGSISDVDFKTIQFTDILFRGIDVRQDFGDEGRPMGNVKITSLNITTVTGYMTDKYLRAVNIFCGTDGCANWNWSNIDIQRAEVENDCNYIPNGFDCW